MGQCPNSENGGTEALGGRLNSSKEGQRRCRSEDAVPVQDLTASSFEGGRRDQKSFPHIRLPSHSQSVRGEKGLKKRNFL